MRCNFINPGKEVLVGGATGNLLPQYSAVLDSGFTVFV
jgi:hypothetical protein